MYAVIGGIDLDSNQPGYKHIIMRPQPGGGLTSARAELQSMYGTIRSAWTWKNNTFKWDITIPANTTATIYIPAQDISEVTEGGQPVHNSEEVTSLRMEDGCAVFTVEPGSYTFSAVMMQESV